MAKIGLKHVVGAKLDADSLTPKYTNGLIIGKAINANVSIEINEAVLFADDAVAESVKSFKSGKVSLNLDDLLYEVQGLLLGHKLTDGVLRANSNDVAPYVGVGFYGAVLRNNVTKYRAVWLYKVQFGEPGDESKTKGDSIEFTTPTIEGNVMNLPDGLWKDETIVTTETAAQMWLDEKAGLAASTGAETGGSGDETP